MEEIIKRKSIILKGGDRLPIFYNIVYYNKLIPFFIEEKSIYYSKYSNSKTGALPPVKPIANIIKYPNEYEDQE